MSSLAVIFIAMIVKEMVIMIVNYCLLLCRLVFAVIHGILKVWVGLGSSSDKNVDSAPEKTNIGDICER